MTLVVETGIGVRGANAYGTSAFVDSYLTARGRETESNWSTITTAEKEDAITKATDYIEKRWSTLFKGSRRVTFEDQKAEGSIAFTGLPGDSETLTLGNITYTLVSSITEGNSNEVLIGGTASATATNLKNAINNDADTGGTSHEGILEANRHATVTQDGATLDLVATGEGAGGNDTILSGSPSNVTLTAFSGGVDGGPQPLSFPRAGCTDASGTIVYGVPLKVRQCMAEYAVRAVATELLVDPTDDSLDGSIKRLKEKVGPIETDTEYSEGSTGATLASYPAADRLLLEYLKPAGVIRA